MPAHDTTRLGEPCWVDLISTDPASAEAFYTALFGWTATTSGPEYGNYVTFWNGDAQVAGLAGVMPGADMRRSAWTTYLSTTDADATTAAALEAGGQVLTAPMTVGEQGRMAVLVDPSGAVFGIWQSAAHTGFGRFGEAGTPVWIELSTRDWNAAVPFYEKVFDLRLTPLSDTDDFRYSTFGPSDGFTGGIYDSDSFLPPGMPSHWLLYLGVSDVAAAARRVSELGGAVQREPWDTEFGTFAQVNDPTGATFLLSSIRGA